MLNIRIDHKKLEGEIMFSGTAQDLLVELSHAISHIYCKFLASDPALAEVYRYSLTKALSDPNSPIWEKNATPAGILIQFPGGRS